MRSRHVNEVDWSKPAVDAFARVLRTCECGQECESILDAVEHCETVEEINVLDLQ